MLWRVLYCGPMLWRVLYCGGCSLPHVGYPMLATHAKCGCKVQHAAAGLLKNDARLHHFVICHAALDPGVAITEHSVGLRRGLLVVCWWSAGCSPHPSTARLHPSTAGGLLAAVRTPLQPVCTPLQPGALVALWVARVLRSAARCVTVKDSRGGSLPLRCLLG